MGIHSGRRRVHSALKTYRATDRYNYPLFDSEYLSLKALYILRFHIGGTMALHANSESIQVPGPGPLDTLNTLNSPLDLSLQTLQCNSPPTPPSSLLCCLHYLSKRIFAATIHHREYAPSDSPTAPTMSTNTCRRGLHRRALLPDQILGSAVAPDHMQLFVRPSL